MNSEVITAIIGAIATGSGVFITKYFAEKAKYHKSMSEIQQNQLMTNDILSKIDEKQNSELSDIKSEVAKLSIELKAISDDNKKFKEASLIPEQVEKKCSIELDNYPLLCPELRSACFRGIYIGAGFFKKLYFKEVFDRNHEEEMLKNIFKEVRGNVTVANLLVREGKELEFFEKLRDALRKQPELILNDVISFRNEYYNGKTLDMYVIVAVNCITRIIDIVDTLYNSYRK